MDGPSKEHDLVLQARLRGQAPDIDPVVYLTDCDLTDFAPGSIVQAEIVDARDYDLVARPSSRPLRRARVNHGRVADVAQHRSRDNLRGRSCRGK